MFRLMPVHFVCYAEGRLFVWIESLHEQVSRRERRDHREKRIKSWASPSRPSRPQGIPQLLGADTARADGRKAGPYRCQINLRSGSSARCGVALLATVKT